MLNAAYRGTDLHGRLAGEGVDFEASGRPSQRQRLTAEDLKEFLDAARGEVVVPAATARAWMVRGTNVEGYNLVPDWLKDGFVSLGASQLGFPDPRNWLRRAEDSYRGRLPAQVLCIPGTAT